MSCGVSIDKICTKETHFVKRSEYISTSCLARSIGLGPAGTSGSELPNQLILDNYYGTRGKSGVVCSDSSQLTQQTTPDTQFTKRTKEGFNTISTSIWFGVEFFTPQIWNRIQYCKY